jgi:hypothetical protein
MPRCVVDCMLVGGLSPTFGELLCGRWCLRAFVVSIKGNERCFGDRKRTLEKISLYFPLLARWFLFYTSCVFGGALHF